MKELKSFILVLSSSVPPFFSFPSFFLFYVFMKPVGYLNLTVSTYIHDQAWLNAHFRIVSPCISHGFLGVFPSLGLTFGLSPKQLLACPGHFSAPTPAPFSFSVLYRLIM